MITWHDYKYEATLIEEFKVSIVHPAYEEPIELDQCQLCGVWLSEDEEIYHDNIDGKHYCDDCSALCGNCGSCFNRVNMSVDPQTEMMACNHCLKKIDRYQRIIDDFDDIEAQEGDVKVVFEYIGEGYCGEYRESGKEDDAPLLRFTIHEKYYVNDGSGTDHPDWNWVEVDSGSYCTTVTIDTPKEIVEKFAKHILDEVKDYIAAERSIRSVAAGLSHINTDAIL